MNGFSFEYLAAVMIFSGLFFAAVYVVMRVLAGAIADDEMSRDLSQIDDEAE